MPADDAPIQIVAHDPDWARLFPEEREALRRVPGPWLKGHCMEPHTSTNEHG